MMLLKKISYKKILILLLFLSIFIRVYRLDFPNKYVFDEVYHAFTAKEYLLGHKEAWEWWTKPPPGVAYEWTHPPLAKEIMTSSMFILRTQDSWAYRLPGTLMGALSVYLVYLLGKRLLKNDIASLIAAFAFSLDGLNFVQSRTGMNDIYFVTFMLGSVLLFLNKKFFLASLLLGLSISSKWAGIYTYLIFIPLLIKEKNWKEIIYFVIFPPIVYLISYIPFLLSGHNIDQLGQLQQQMWWYHTNLKATHEYASPWWSWPINLYPVWYFVDYQKNNIANIFASGNPAVFWLGFVSIIFCFWEAIKRRSENLIIILMGFFAFWLPWAISPRIMFLYHFSPSVPFMCLALGYQLSILEKENRKIHLITILTLILLGFIIIYPFLTGIPIQKDLVNTFFFTNFSKNPF